MNPNPRPHLRQWPVFVLAVLCVALAELALYGAYWAIEGSKEPPRALQVTK